MSEHEKQVRKFPRHIRAYLRKKIHQNIFKDEYKIIAENIKQKIREKEEMKKQLVFPFALLLMLSGCCQKKPEANNNKISLEMIRESANMDIYKFKDEGHTCYVMFGTNERGGVSCPH